jgi:3-deoxy-D-manno-octulosonate 8-phosphate phosphatase (KDO 8-P phosphatase)
MVIRAVALDVDGVLTDGAFWWGADGGEWKRVSFRDAAGESQRGAGEWRA